LNERSGVAESVVGVAVLGSIVTGVAGLIGALFAFFGGDFVAAGVFLIAAALSYGLLGMAILDK
jgi:hypothetical protein